MRIAVLVLRHPPSRPSPVVPEMLRGLIQRGCAVEVLTPDEGVLDLAAQRPRHDLYVLKSGTESALSLAGALHHQGARIVNPYPVAVACRDKIVQTPILQAAGVPAASPFARLVGRAWTLGLRTSSIGAVRAALAADVGEALLVSA